MLINPHDVAYLARLMEKLKTDTSLETTMDCPECDTSLEKPGEGDAYHILLTTWESPEDYTEGRIRKTLAIGCEGYHLYQDI